MPGRLQGSWWYWLPMVPLLGACSGAESGRAAESREAISFVATDGGHQGPTVGPAGVSHILFANQGSEVHELMFVKLPDGMSASDYLAEVRGGDPFPDGALDYSGPGLTKAGGRVEVWLHLDPGEYVVVCWFRNHLETHRVHTFTVVESSLPDAEVPPAAVGLTLADYRFELEGELQAGSQVIRVHSPGPSLHEVDFFRLLPDRTLEDLRAWQAGGKVGAAPAVAVGGVLDSHDMRRPVWLRLTLEPGRYVLWCNMDMIPEGPGSEDSPTHADVGMYLEVSIV